MTLTQMQYFDAVCRHESYTKTAQELLVSQPAISQSMRELEAECGTPLFARQGNTLTITQQGKLLQEEVKQVLEQIQHLHHVIHDLGMTRNFVRIGLSTIFGNTVFPRLRREFHRRYPDIETISYENVTPTLFEMLDTEKGDLLITTPGGGSSPPILGQELSCISASRVSAEILRTPSPSAGFRRLCHAGGHLRGTVGHAG